jgi:hypothetical protein
MHAWFTAGEYLQLRCGSSPCYASTYILYLSGLCDTPRDARAQIASLYYAFAMDVLSDIMSTSPVLPPPSDTSPNACSYSNGPPTWPNMEPPNAPRPKSRHRRHLLRRHNLHRHRHHPRRPNRRQI